MTVNESVPKYAGSPTHPSGVLPSYLSGKFKVLIGEAKNPSEIITSQTNMTTTMHSTTIQMEADLKRILRMSSMEEEHSIPVVKAWEKEVLQRIESFVLDKSLSRDCKEDIGVLSRDVGEYLDGISYTPDNAACDTEMAKSDTSEDADPSLVIKEEETLYQMVRSNYGKLNNFILRYSDSCGFNVHWYRKKSRQRGFYFRYVSYV